MDFVSLCPPVSHYRSLSLFTCLCHSISLSPPLPPPPLSSCLPSFPVSHSLSISAYLTLYPCVLSFPVSHSLSISLYLTFYPCVLSFPVSLTLCLSLPTSLSIPVSSPFLSLTLCLSLSTSLSIPVSYLFLSLSLFVYLSLPHSVPCVLSPQVSNQRLREAPSSGRSAHTPVHTASATGHHRGQCV